MMKRKNRNSRVNLLMLAFIFVMCSASTAPSCSKNSSTTAPAASPSPSTSSSSFPNMYAATSGITVLHGFGATSADGQMPAATLVLAGSTLYGTAPAGYDCSGGIIFSIGIDGSNYTSLHCFLGGTGSFGGLVVSGNKIYGMTEIGGSGSCPWWGGETISCGTIFSMGTDGSNFTVLHNFTGGSNDGALPMGGLVLSGNKLFGMTHYGGSGSCTFSGLNTSCGTVFGINTDGSGFAVLHSFQGLSSNDGSEPLGDLIVSGNTLYGMTSTGGTGCVYNNGCGTIFRIGLDGSGYTVLKYFAPGTGTNPFGNLAVSGNILYGMTSVAGPGGCTGTVFSISTDGSGFNVVHSFLNPSEGDHPLGSLVLSNGMLYGMTSYNGAYGNGSIFKVSTDGSGYDLLTSFTSQSGDGAFPVGGLVVGGSTVYGTTQKGGYHQGGYGGSATCPGGCGVVFRFGI